MPGAEVTFDMPSRPVLYEPGTLAYDFAALIECVDYFMVMDYDMATPPPRAWEPCAGTVLGAEEIFTAINPFTLLEIFLGPR